MRFFDGCTALITGASSGLGAEFAGQLAPHAHALVLVARRGDRLEALGRSLESAHPPLRVLTYVADLASGTERHALLAWLEEQNLPVDLLVNNAGLGDHGPFETSEWDRARAMLDVNITALTHLTHGLLPTLRRSQRAAILNVSSVASFFPVPNMAVYSATKAYVTSFSETLRIELRGTGISVTALCPGPIPTEFFDVAARPGETPKAHYKSMPQFAVTAAGAVATGLRAVASDRARVIPGPWLCLGVALSALVPFFILRRIIAALRKNF